MKGIEVSRVSIDGVDGLFMPEEGVRFLYRVLHVVAALMIDNVLYLKNHLLLTQITEYLGGIRKLFPEIGVTNRKDVQMLVDYQMEESDRWRNQEVDKNGDG